MQASIQAYQYASKHTSKRAFKHPWMEGVMPAATEMTYGTVLGQAVPLETAATASPA